MLASATLAEADPTPFFFCCIVSEPFTTNGLPFTVAEFWRQRFPSTYSGATTLTL